MKTIFALLAALFLLSSGIALAEELKADSKISEVIVYSGDALVKRVAQVKLASGDDKVVFADIIPEIDENSLRVSGEGSASVKILGAYVKKEFLKEQPVDKVKAIQDEIQKLEDQIRKLEDTKKILADEKLFLDSVRLFSKDQLPKDLVTKMPPAKELSDTLAFLDVKLKDNYSQVIQAELNIRETRKQIDVLRRQLLDVAGPMQKMKRSIIVDLEVVKPGNMNLEVAYRVRGAYWYPIYDARVNFDKQETELVSFAVVKQNTGEDWQEVSMSLSTAKVDVSGNLPEPESWFLRPYRPVVIREEKWDKDMEAEGRIMMKAGSPSVLSPAESMDASYAQGPMKKERAKFSYAIQEEKGISVIYKIAKTANVKSGGEEYKLPISTQVLSSAFAYSAYPRISTFAYLGSKVTNAKDLQLLGGRVNVFLDGDFVGVSQIKSIAPQEEFDLYLGVDENVKVKRELLEKKVDETLIAGIPSPTKKTVYKYKITVENYKTKNIKAKIFEAIPVSEDDRIKVKIEKLSLEPTQKDWKDKKGIWLWELGLAPKEKKEIFYNCTVEHPRDMQIEGL